MSQPLDLSQFPDLPPEVVRAFEAAQFELSVERAARLHEQAVVGVCCRTGLNPTLSPFRPSVFPREQDVGPSEGRDVSQEAG